MAIATTGGHIARALEFYNTVGKYFIIGGTQPWEDESAPPAPEADEFKLRDVVGLKRVDNTYLVVPHPNGSIQYRDQNWKIVSAKVNTTIIDPGVMRGESVIPVASVAGLVEGAKVRINNSYEATILSTSGSMITVDTPAPEDLPVGSTVLGGALVEGAKYVYVDCYLNYDEFPLVTYRQIGLCTGVTPNTENVLKSAAYSIGGKNEYTSLGILEVLDNRVPATRDISQREQLSLIVEF